jgi:hypothetical protein
MSVIGFPFESTLEQPTNDPKQEFVLMCCEGQPPVRQKRLILQARHPDVGLIDASTAEILIDALNLAAE